MVHVYRSRPIAGWAVGIGIILIVGAGVLWRAELVRPRSAGSSPLALLKPTGYPQLVSIEPLPEMGTEGELCQWVPASSQKKLVAGASFADAEAPNYVTLQRKPVRVIRDPFPTFSAVAVDAKNNEIVLLDENLFQIMAYDRMANTPPKASMTEPKRIIGGLETDIEFNCGLYIDPQSGDIYSVNNDRIEQMVVFSRNARGNVRPDRQLRTPHSTFGVTVDEVHQELFMTIQNPPMVTVYPKFAKGEDKPIRVLRGNTTGLGDPHGIGLDVKDGWMFIANFGGVADYKDGGGDGLPKKEEGVVVPGTSLLVPGSGRYEPASITVYSLQAKGDTAPLRTIRGPSTQLNWPAHVYVDEQHGEIFVANDGDSSIVVFRVTDNGNAAPTRVLKGPRTQIKNPIGVFVDLSNDELVVASMGNHEATVYRRTAQGDTAPLRTIRAGPANVPALQIGNPGAVAYDTKRDEILVPN
jgi:hypothetical protein